MNRLILPALLAALAATLVTPALAVDAGTDYEAVTFRVTLEGKVDPGHTFAVRQACEEEQCVTEDFVVVCAPPDPSYDWPSCSARSFEYTVQVRAGLTLEFALLRWTTPSTQDQPDAHLAGSWVVQDGAQSISLGYVYPSLNTLPDTAMPHGS